MKILMKRSCLNNEKNKEKSQSIKLHCIRPLIKTSLVPKTLLIPWRQKLTSPRIPISGKAEISTWRSLSDDGIFCSLRPCYCNVSPWLFVAPCCDPLYINKMSTYNCDVTCAVSIKISCARRSARYLIDLDSRIKN